jgi:hypothetical protein
MVAASGSKRAWWGMKGEVRERGKRGKMAAGEECNKAGAIDRANGNKTQQSANDGDDSQQGHEDATNNSTTGKGGKA